MPNPLTPPSRGRGRFAPSPTGPLHWGSVLTAVGSWLAARQHGHEWLVRIEDLDPPREQRGAAERQLATLARLGLHADRDIVWQSRRHALYREALDVLIGVGSAFACRCSRADLQASGGIHRACVALPPDARRTRSFRLRVADGDIAFDDAIHGRIVQDVGRDVGDVVLRRADGFWAYQLAVVVDDAEQGITDVVRGADLLDSTPRQILLQRALAYPQPRYAHLPLWRDASGRKLSKSEGAHSVDDQPVEQVLRRCWQALGQAMDAWQWRGTGEASLAACAPAFDIARVPRELPPGTGGPRAHADAAAD